MLYFQKQNLRLCAPPMVLSSLSSGYVNPYHGQKPFFSLHTKGLYGAQGRGREGSPMLCVLPNQKLVLAKFAIPRISINMKWKVVVNNYGLWMRLLIWWIPFLFLRHVSTWSYLSFSLFFLFFLFFFPSFFLFSYLFFSSSHSSMSPFARDFWGRNMDGVFIWKTIVCG